MERLLIGLLALLAFAFVINPAVGFIAGKHPPIYHGL